MSEARNSLLTVDRDSLRKRYAFKVGAAVLGTPFGLVVQFLCSRTLGPVGYGSYSFINGFFTEVMTFLDAGTSAGFYAKLCARPNERELVVFYWRLVGVIAIFLSGLIALVFLLGFGLRVWPNQRPAYVSLGAMGAFSVWVAGVVGRAVDAYGLTVIGEKVRLAQRVILALLVVVAAAVGVLSLANFFLIQWLAAIILALGGAWVLWQGGHAVYPRVALRRAATVRYVREFWAYSHPLITYATAGLLAGLSDRWTLQRFGGNVEQGFFGLATQLGAACFLVTSTFVPLLGREFSRAHAMVERDGIRRIFDQQAKRFFTLTCIIAVFVACNASDIARVVGGAQFAGAAPALALMCLGPIHQSYGQINGALFLATGETQAYRNIGVILLCVGIPINLLLVGPARYGGLDLGATGLAIKVTLLQCVGVNVQLYWIANRLQLSFRRLFWQQIYTISILLAIGLAALLLARHADQALTRLAISGACYSLLVLFLSWGAPRVLSIPVMAWLGEGWNRAFSAMKRKANSI